MTEAVDRVTAQRSTRQRAAVAAVLAAEPTFRSAQDIHERLRSQGDKVGLTTVYRTLQGLADAGEVDVLRTADGESVYRQCASDDHHHHLVCRACGRTIEVAAPEVEEWSARLARRHGFSEVTHTLDIFGVCRRCTG
ncbi:MAG TPA: transcriptional repressor [Mycobacteriales bacterium]|nr:transcriptional repressor [Mycobacteriales bacterium]